MTGPTLPLHGERERLYGKTLACVHCGLCLPACPAYGNAPRESLAPRGQVYIARALLEGRLEPSAGIAEDLYECLACRGCETVCPAGVEVGAIVEGVRGLLDEEGVESRSTRFLRRVLLGGVVARPRVLAAAMAAVRLGSGLGLRRLVRAALRRLAPRWASREALLPEPPPHERLPRRFAAQGPVRKGRASLFLGCVAAHLRPETSRAAAEALARNGWDVEVPPAQRCCGALHLHAGLRDQARRLARRNLDAFPGDGPIVTTAAGCGAALAETGELLPGDDRARAFGARVSDVSALLVRGGFEAPAPAPASATRPTRTVYDAPCHLFHAQRIRDEPLEILGAVPGIELVPFRDPERCCGSAGIYSITRHESSMAVLDRKMEAIAPARPELIATGNIGCHLQLAAGVRRAGLAAEVAHPVELLARAYRHADGEDAAADGDD